MKYVKEFTSHFGRFPLFSFASARLFFSIKGSNDVYAKKFISRMLQSGRVFRITKGDYSFNKNMLAVGLAYKPYYYGLEYALTYYDLWNQRANLTVLTTQKVREGVRVAFGINYVLKRVPQRLFFGFHRADSGSGFNIQVSDIEKAFLDMVYFRRYMSGDTLEKFSNRVDSKKLSSYGGRLGEVFRRRALDMLGLD